VCLTRFGVDPPIFGVFEGVGLIELGGAGGLAIVRMQEADQQRVRHARIGIETPNPAVLVRDVEPAGLGIPLEGADAPSFLRNPQALLNAPALGCVLDEGKDTGRDALLVKDRAAVEIQPDIFR
jgi:hypothetical protein